MVIIMLHGPHMGVFSGGSNTWGPGDRQKYLPYIVVEGGGGFAK